MGETSAEPEPSMEDILSSIKRIIADESDIPPGRPRRAAGAPTAKPDAKPDAKLGDREEVLELNEPAPEARDTVAPSAALGESPTRFPPDGILSHHAAAASRGPLDALSRLVVKPDVAGSDTLEGMVREMLRPMLKDWLDAHLPTLVETMVAREIERITGK